MDNNILYNIDIEALKVNQGIINRMADNSAKCKTIFLAITTAMVTFAKQDDLCFNVFAIAIYLVLTIALWYSDAKYLQLEKMFRAHHQRIVDGTYDKRQAWEFNLKQIEPPTIKSIMFRNFTMALYMIASVTSACLLVYLIFTYSL